MAVSETSERAEAPAGVWRHRLTGQELIAVATEKFGNPQGNAYARMGFEYVGPVTKKADKEAVGLVGDPTVNEQDLTANVKSVEQLEAELAAAKAREASFKEATKKNEETTEAHLEETQSKTVSDSASSKKGGK